MTLTALTLNRDEPTLLESIDSVIHMVDTLVLVDASKDKTLYHQALARHPDKIIAREAEPNIKTQCRLGHSLIDTRWVLRWDADFIAYPELEKTLNVITHLEGEIAVSYYCHDERNKRPNSPYKNHHRETYLFTNSPKFGTMHLRKLLGTIIGHRHSNIFAPIPYGYTFINLDQTLFLHKDVKPEWRKTEKQKQIDIARRTP